MMIKEGHRHVAADGMVYMPYLHTWRNGSHNLVDACLAMSQMFGQDPPVYSKPPGYTQTNPTPPPPPRYEQVAAVPNTASVASGSKPFVVNTSISEPNTKNSSGISGVFSSLVGNFNNGFGKMDMNTAEEKLAKEAQEANEVAAVARAAEEKEKQERKLAQETRDSLTQLSRDILDKYRASSMEGLRNDFKDQILVEKSKTFVQDPKEGQIAYLKKRKQELEKYHQEVDGCIDKLSLFIKNVEKEKSSRSAAEISADELAVPRDIHSAQMLLLSAENAAINDALYFLDKALADNSISLEDHLRVVRKLSKQQFLVKAHLLKIGQVKASESIASRNAWS
jgi:ESCRT-I complex subunit TSG101